MKYLFILGDREKNKMYFLVLFLYYFVPAQIMLYLYYSCINIEKAAGQKRRPTAWGREAAAGQVW
ncbi:hypothetical protein HMPREF1548_05178 [Clostridium sp. KLE 1755]|jgi:hypothetical protein|nr:hypothetical protein HMPREF1548_05178 [Clostridium sp. KLE 1755]